MVHWRFIGVFMENLFRGYALNGEYHPSLFKDPSPCIARVSSILVLLKSNYCKTLRFLFLHDSESTSGYFGQFNEPHI